MTNSEAGNRFEPHYRAFKQLERDLMETEWFADDWRAEVGYYGGDNPQGVSFRLYKNGWFNGGIHFESWVGNADLKRHSVPVALHVEISSETTGIKRGQFNKAILEQGAPLMEDWADCKVSPNSYQPFIRHLPFTADTLVARLTMEYLRLHRLAAIIDQVISNAAKQG